MKSLISMGVLFVVLFSCKPASKPNAATQDELITDKYWKLVELSGNPVESDTTSRAAHIIFRNGENKFNGNTGCNTMAGTYELKEMNKISLSNIISTKMACMDDMETETQFLRILNEADSYVLSGDTLILNRARMAPLARFKRENTSTR
jgi:heat shock protein HslJ